ncbi:MAG: SIMPL domain-containing protein, partial [bacterium]
EQKIKIYKILKIALFVFLIVIVFDFFTGSDGGKYDNNKVVNVITVTGHGEMQAVPDIANVSFTIRKEAKTVKDAQMQVKAIEKKVLESLSVNKVSLNDTKTTNASFNPKYEYKNVVCNQYSCPSNSVIVGYEAYESISLKIRDVDSVGKIIEDLGSVGVTELSGPNFAVDKEDEFKIKARKEAIDDAQLKAKVLAKDLGIRLGKMTSFSEGGNYPSPMYAKTMMADSVAMSSAPAVLPVGENTINSDVTLTYEIR